MNQLLYFPAFPVAFLWCAVSKPKNGCRKVNIIKIIESYFSESYSTQNFFCVCLPLWRTQPSPTPDTCGFVASHMKWNKSRCSVTFLRNTTKWCEDRLSAWALTHRRVITFLDFPLYLMEIFKNWSSLHGYVVLVFLTSLGKGKYCMFCMSFHSFELRNVSFISVTLCSAFTIDFSLITCMKVITQPSKYISREILVVLSAVCGFHTLQLTSALHCYV